MLSIIFCFFSLFMSLSSFCFVSLFVLRKRRVVRENLELEAREFRESNREDPSSREDCGGSKGRTHLTNSLLLEILPHDSEKWASLLAGEARICDDSRGSVDSGDRRLKKKKKKKKRSKKKVGSDLDLDSNCESGSGSVGDGDDRREARDELVCLLYPFTSSSSAMQRRIKQQFDQLVESQESRGLTVAQVGQFANCLVEARNELQQKSEAIQRKFPLKKALLFKADRSSFDRIRQQVG